MNSNDLNPYSAPQHIDSQEDLFLSTSAPQHLLPKLPLIATGMRYLLWSFLIPMIGAVVIVVGLLALMAFLEYNSVGLGGQGQFLQRIIGTMMQYAKVIYGATLLVSLTGLTLRVLGFKKLALFPKESILFKRASISIIATYCLIGLSLVGGIFAFIDQLAEITLLNQSLNTVGTVLVIITLHNAADYFYLFAEEFREPYLISKSSWFRKLILLLNCTMIAVSILGFLTNALPQVARTAAPTNEELALKIVNGIVGLTFWVLMLMAIIAYLKMLRHVSAKAKAFSLGPQFEEANA